MNNNWGPTVFNTWVGDPARLVVLDAILDTVAESNLCENATLTGNYIKEELTVSSFPLFKSFISYFRELPRTTSMLPMSEAGEPLLHGITSQWPSVMQ